MAEPLFIVADIDLSAPALRRWLKSAPLSVAAFDDWPESVRLGAPGLTELAPPVEPCVADALVSYCVDSFGREDGHLHCRHDEQAHALRFAACFQYGDEAGALASALFLCALLRGLAQAYTARQPSFIRLFNADDDLVCIGIGKQSSRVLPAPAHARVSPPWFDDWISQDNLGDPGRLMVALFPPLARALKKQLALGALQASPDAPHHYDSHFWTDGEHVYRWPGDQPVPGAAPRTFRRVTPANAMDSAFYTDGRQVWYHRPMVGVVPVQALESGTAMQGWRPFGSDGEPLLRCGDTVWTVACMDYPDSGNAPDEANYPLGGNTPANVARVLEGIASQDGIPTWEKAYDYEYLRPTRVLGKSFAHVQDSLFEDGESVYVQAAQGLLRLEGALPGMTTDLGALSLNNGRVFHRGQAIRRQPDAATLRHIGHDLYADDRRVYLLRHEMDGIHSHPDLRILQDADPARFRIRHVLPHAILSDDEQQVWLNGEPLHGVTPRAIKLMGVFFWTDGVHVYHCEKRIAQADPARFDVLADSDYARQDDAVYFRDQRIPGADAASFVADDMSTAHDRRRRYLFEEPVMSQDDAADS